VTIRGEVAVVVVSYVVTVAVLSVAMTAGRACVEAHRPAPCVCAEKDGGH
jgi:hypothetical protein